MNSALFQAPLAARPIEHADTVLAGKVSTGDEAAFEQLYLRYREPIGRMVVNVVRDTTVAADLVQEIFTKTYFALRRTRKTRLGIAPGGFRPGMPFRPWLYRVATNHCLDYLRKRARQPFQVSVEEEYNGEAGVAVLPDAAPDALRALMSRDLAGKLLRGLRPRDRMLLVLKEIEELSLEDISEVTGMGVTAVKVALFRARRRMLDRYRKMQPEARSVSC